MEVTQAMLEAGVVAYFYAQDGNTAAGPDEIVHDIYLAMKAKELPLETVERLIEQWQRDQSEFFTAPVLEIVSEYARWREARTSLGTDGGERRD